MKYLLYNLLNHTGRLWSYIYTKNLSANLKIIKVIVYTGWISKTLRKKGDQSLIFYPCDIYGGSSISVGSRCTIGKNATLSAWFKHGSQTFTPQIIIKDNVSIGEDSHITAINKIVIGNNVLTGKKITISDNSHGDNTKECLLIEPSKRLLFSKGPILIEDNVWIGDKATILSNVHIGKNSIIGANAVVTTNIPANSIAVGIPAKVIKMII